MFVGSPALLAILGLAAYAGLRSRERVSDIRNEDGNDQADSTEPWTEDGPQGGSFGGGFGGVFPGGIGGGFVFDLSDLLATQPRGAVVSGGLGDLIRQLEAAGYGPAAESWVSDGPNQPVRPDELKHAFDEDLLLELEQRTGLPRAQIVERLATGLPDIVNELTPQGRLPTESEAEQLVASSDQVDSLQPTPQGKARPDAKGGPFILGHEAVELKEPGT